MSGFCTVQHAVESLLEVQVSPGVSKEFSVRD